MGGDYEKTVETVRPDKGGAESGGGVIVQGVRFHKSGGDVHFHDDKNGLKVAMPAAEWYAAWNRLRCPNLPAGDPDEEDDLTSRFTWVDQAQGTALMINCDLSRVELKKRNKGEPEFELTASIAIVRVDARKPWRTLDEFTNQAKGRS